MKDMVFEGAPLRPEMKAEYVSRKQKEFMHQKVEMPFQILLPCTNFKVKVKLKIKIIIEIGTMQAAMLDRMTASKICTFILFYLSFWSACLGF